MVALWLADISHVAITCCIMGNEKLIDIGNWNSMAWGNIGATVSNTKSCCVTMTKLSSAGFSVFYSYSLSSRPFWARSTASTFIGSGKEKSLSHSNNSCQNWG